MCTLGIEGEIIRVGRANKTGRTNLTPPKNRKHKIKRRW